MADVEIDVQPNSVTVQVGGVDSITAGAGLTGGIITSSGTVAVDFAADGGGTSNQVPRATDTRLSNARTPTSHAASHGSAGTDPVTIAQTQVTGLVTALNGKASILTAINSGTGLSGGGNLSVDRTLSVVYGTTSGTACQGNDSRLSDARTPTAHAATHGSAGSDPITIAQTQVTSLVSDLAGKVPITRTVTASTGLTGGGDLSANRTFAVDFAASGSATAGKAVEATDSRLSNARTPTGAAGGDLTGSTYPNPTIARLATYPISTSAPAAGDVWVYDGSTWQHTAGTDVQRFTTSGTWTKPTGCKSVRMVLIGAGGGGGSGHSHATGNKGGGGGGAGGGITELVYRATDLPSTLTVTVGTGGAGGAGVSGNTNGNPGSAGGATSVSASGTTYGYAAGGAAGQGGTNSGGSGGVVGVLGDALYAGNEGGAGGNPGVVGNVGAAGIGAAGGGGGGGMTSGGTTANGGNGGTRISIGTGGSGTTGGAGTAVGIWGSGGGGSPSVAGTSAVGGAGIYGSGGGGSGGGTTATGAGGAGGAGLVLIVSEY